MHLPKILKNKSLRTFRYFSLGRFLNKNSVAFVEHDLFSKTFLNVTKGAQNTEETLFVYVNTGPPNLIPVTRLDRNELLKTIATIYSVCSTNNNLDLF